MQKSEDTKITKSSSHLLSVTNSCVGATRKRPMFKDNTASVMVELRTEQNALGAQKFLNSNGLMEGFLRK